MSKDAPEVGLDGWQDLEGSYALAYLKSTGKPMQILAHQIKSEEMMRLHAQ